jgi:hypothetical protein
MQIAVDVVGWIIRSVSQRDCWRRLLASIRKEVVSSIKGEEGVCPQIRSVAVHGEVREKTRSAIIQNRPT